MSGDFSLQASKQTVQSCFSRLIGGSSKYARNNSYTVPITVQAQVAQRADNSYPTDKWLSSYSNVLSFGNLDKTPIKSLEFDAREFSSIGRSILLFASLEK